MTGKMTRKDRTKQGNYTNTNIKEGEAIVEARVNVQILCGSI